MIGSFPLPKDHWIYEEIPAPMPLRMANNAIIMISLPDREIKLTKEEFIGIIRDIGKYAVRTSTMNGKNMDLDPDAMLQNLVIGFLGENNERDNIA
jgi:hypothetical protein